jgi:hypothetical protein
MRVGLIVRIGLGIDGGSEIYRGLKQESFRRGNRGTNCQVDE